MRIPVISVFFYLLISSGLFAQKEASNWFFGNNNGAVFTGTNNAVSSTTGAITTTLGCSSISNANGNLLFYTDGVTVYNQQHSVMANGTGLLGTNSGQCCVIVPRPASSNLYYIFTITGGGAPFGLRYSIVDMNLASGNGSLTVKNATLSANACEEKITATKHCNGTDFWVLCKEIGSSGMFKAYLLNSTGVNSVAVASGAYWSEGFSPSGTMKFSPNGKKIGVTYNTTINGFSPSRVQVREFDNATGIVGNITIDYTTGNPGYPVVFGCEFSPDGSKFYATFYGSFFQWDLCLPANQNPAGIEQISSEVPPETNAKASLQLAPDGKIYVAKIGHSILGVINSPNQYSFAANYVPAGLSLGTNTCGFGLPNFPTNFLEKRNSNFTFTSNPLSCLTASFTGPAPCSATGYTVTGYNWNFGEPSSGAANSSTLANPVHSYSATGNYTTQLITYYDCNKSDTVRKTISITSPTITVNSSLNNCGPVSATVSTAGGTGTYSYTWSPSAQYSSTVSNLSSGIYTVNMRDLEGGCSGSQTVSINTIILNATVTVTNPSCNGALTGSANMAVSGGSSSFSYSWSAGTSTLSSISGLGAGNYSVTALDLVNSCSVANVFTLTQPPPINISFLSNTYTACVGNSIMLSVNVVGGSPVYQYAWSGGGAAAYKMFSEQLAGTYVYSLTVSDANNCQLTNTVVASFIPTPTLNIPSVSVCPGITGTLTATGANSYTWQPGSVFGSTLAATATSNVVYSVTGNVGDCSSTATTAIVIMPVPIVTLSSNSPVCAGQLLNLMSSSGASYVWSGPQSFNSTSQNPSIVSSQINSGVYTISVTAANSCTSSAVITVSILPLPVLNVTGNVPLCPGEQTTLTASGATSYSWSTGAMTPVVSLNPSITSIYTLTGTETSSGCSNSLALQVVVKPPTLIQINAKSEICLGEAVTLTASGATSYTWSNNLTSPLIKLYPQSNTVYSVTGNTGVNTCEGKAQITVTVHKCTGVREFEQSGLLIIPNPSSGKFVVKSEIKGIIMVVNELGAVIFSENHNSSETTIDISEQAAGLYILRFISSSLIQSKKIVKY